MHPQANPNDYNLLSEFSNNVVVHTPGSKSNFQDRLFTKKDDIEFVESLTYCDVLINLASTVTIDAAVFDKPIICENIDLWGYQDIYSSIQKFYEFDHFAKLSETNGFDIVRSIEELVERINFLFSNPTYKHSERQKIVEQQCYYMDGKSGYRTANHILEVLDTVTKPNELR
jgi:CDP-glycerol glycerophosphotransferase (TagB/SpsB family)